MIRISEGGGTRFVCPFLVLLADLYNCYLFKKLLKYFCDIMKLLVQGYRVRQPASLLTRQISILKGLTI